MIINDNILYNKIVVLIKRDSIGVTKIEHFNSYIILSGDNLIISRKEEKDEIEVVNEIYPLNTISAYKTYNNNQNLKKAKK